MKLGYPRHGLRLTVRLHGTVVSQRVLWAPPVGELLSLAIATGGLSFLFGQLASGDVTLLGVWSPLMSQLAVLMLFPTGVALALASLFWPRASRVGVGHDAVPTPHGLALATVHWAPRKDPVLVDHQDDDKKIVLDAKGDWRWRHDAVELDLQAQHREVARRLPTDPLGDIGLVVVALALYVGMLQARTFIEVMPGQAAPGADAYEISPELIARLLERDFEGADQGVQPRVDRPELDQDHRGVYLPVGNQGVLSRTGGGATQGDEVHRTDPVEEEDESLPIADVLPEEGEDLFAMEAAPEPEQFLPPAAQQPSPDPVDLDQADELATRSHDPMERFIGWGFRDWMDAAEQQKKLDPAVERQLRIARERLRLDPDDFGALQVVGHYAYLAEDVELCRSAYQRVVELYPQETAGYNNLALTYKRDGDFEKEEALYRKALELEPTDPVVLNNLAVSLAHQGRFDEALSLMTLLEEIDPDDPYSELHRAKIFAAMGKREKAYRSLKRALDGIDQLDTLHHIEFRQDLRIEPLFAEMRKEARFQRLLHQVYGDDSVQILEGARGLAREDGGRHG